MKAFKRPHPLAIGIALAVAVPAAVVLGVSGGDDADGAPPAVSHEPNLKVISVQVNGRTVSCVTIDPPGEAFAMSCDWTREAS